MEYYELDRDGDVVLVLRNQLPQCFFIAGHERERGIGLVMDNQPVCFKLSSKHLILASPVFRAMLCGGWKESITPSKTDRDKENNPRDQNAALREITATEWDKRALLLLLKILHGRHQHVPLQLD
ncbi:hypothetical protein E4U53_002560 [Claviceps sorghi]|nr:hypothetical protein E4U53_002560 [Claviceps sorghi]